MSFVPFVILELVIFAIVVVAIRRVFTRNFRDAATRLQDLSAEYLRRQEELKERLGEGERQYQEQLARAKIEAEKIVHDARQEAESFKAGRLEEARVESQRIMQQAIESRDSLKNELVRDADKRAIEQACRLIEETLPDEMRRWCKAPGLKSCFRTGWASSPSCHPVTP
jgi:F-type H+-transporting ATPase subunit b